jgi:hypothetical protein
MLPDPRLHRLFEEHLEKYRYALLYYVVRLQSVASSGRASDSDLIELSYAYGAPKGWFFPGASKKIGPSRLDVSLAISQTVSQAIYTPELLIQTALELGFIEQAVECSNLWTKFCEMRKNGGRSS